MGKRVTSSISRDLFVLEDENNPKGSPVNTVYPTTILDQVFDDQSPVKKTLRQILAELELEIATGGKTSIKFPVTSVNGMTDDVVLNKTHVGLGRVDNTADINKPLSVPQRTAVEEMLANYNFHVNLDDLYNHLANKNNPHEVSISTLDKDGSVSQLIQKFVSIHNISRENTTHTDIRNNLARLWTLTDQLSGSIEERVGSVLELLTTHIEDSNAHLELFNTKEDLKNKVSSFSSTKSGDNVHYPTTKAVMSYVTNELEGFRGTLAPVQDWIDDIIIIKDRTELPTASKAVHRKAYIIRNGLSSFQEIAICRVDSSNRYSWDISEFGTYSKFNTAHFIDSSSGLSINLGAVVDYILSNNGTLDTSLSEVLQDYYTKEKSNERFIRSIKILPGNKNGTLRYYINYDLNTLTEDIPIPGISNLAFRNMISETELQENSVWGRHIIDGAVEGKHVKRNSVPATRIQCKLGYIIGNTSNDDSTEAHEVGLPDLANALRPLIGGWPDPNVPGGNPWYDMLDANLLHPHKMDPAYEYRFSDGTIARRYIGYINALPDNDTYTTLSDELKVPNYRIMECGGSWMYIKDNTNEEWAMLGNSSMIDNTHASITITKNGLYLNTCSHGLREHAMYDVWVRYCPTDNVSTFGY